MMTMVTMILMLPKMFPDLLSIVLLKVQVTVQGDVVAVIRRRGCSSLLAAVMSDAM